MTPGGQKSDVPPAPVTVEQEGPEAQQQREVMAALTTAALNDPAQRLSPLHDNEVVYASLPGLNTKMIDAGPTIPGFTPFSLTVRGSKKRVLAGLKNRSGGAGGDKNQKGAAMQKAIIEMAKEGVDEMKDLGPTQGLELRISFDPRPGAFSSSMGLSTYEVNLPAGVESLEDMEKGEEETLKQSGEDQKKKADEINRNAQAQRLGEAILNQAGQR